MGEEEKKPEEKKEEEAKKPAEEKKEKKEEEKKEEKKEEKPAEESKDGKQEGKEAPPPPPPEEFVYNVFMHCEGCARKVKRSLRGFEGVEDVIADCKAHKVVVKGKTADPLKVLDRIQRKSHRKVELLTPLPKPPAVEPKKADEEKEKPKQDEKKEEPQVIVVTLKVHMHCEACAQEIKKRIMRMKGVQSADPDLKGSQVAVKGVFDPTKLVEYVYKRTGKHAVIVKQEPEKKEGEEKGKEEKKEEKKEGEEKKGEGEEKKEGGEEKKEGEDDSKAEVKKFEYLFNPYFPYPRQQYTVDHVYHQYAPQHYAPQLFSDENPNACSVM